MATLDELTKRKFLLDDFSDAKPVRDMDELRTIDLGTGVNIEGMRRFLRWMSETSGEGILDMAREELIEAKRSMEADFAERLASYMKQNEPELQRYGMDLIMQSNGDSHRALRGLSIVLAPELGEWIRAYANGEHMAEAGKGGLSRLRELSIKVSERIKKLGCENIPIGRLGLSHNDIELARQSRGVANALVSGSIEQIIQKPNGQRATSTTAGAGGDFIPTIFIPIMIDYSYEAFPLFDRFQYYDVAASTGTIPRQLTDLSAAARTELSAGTVSDITTDHITYTCYIRTIFTTPSRELLGTASPALQIQQVVMRGLGRARAIDIKNGYINGTDVSTSPMRGLKDYADDGKLNTTLTASQGKIKETLVNAVGKLGGDDADVSDQAVILCRKSARTAYYNELAAIPEAAVFVANLNSFNQLNVMGAPFELVNKVAASDAFVTIPEQYIFVEVGADREVLIDATGYTNQTQRQVLFMSNYKMDGFLEADGITGNGDRYMTEHITGIPIV